MRISIYNRKAIDAIVSTFRRKPKGYVDHIEINVCDGEDWMFPLLIMSNGFSRITQQRCSVHIYIGEEPCMELTQISTQKAVTIMFNELL